jgi:hypothetical protein
MLRLRGKIIKYRNKMKNKQKQILAGMLVLIITVFSFAVIKYSIGLTIKNYQNFSLSGARIIAGRMVKRVLGVATPVLTLSSPGNGSVLASGTTFVSVDATTDVPAMCKMGQSSGDNFNTMGQIISASATTTHNSILSPLKNDNTYSLYVQCKGEDGSLSNLASVKFYVSAAVVSIDNTPPSIDSFILTELSPTSTKFTWTTSELTDTQIEYGANIPVYGQTTVVTDTGKAMTSTHTQTVTGLTPGVLYYFRAVGKDASGNVGKGLELSLKTLPPNSILWQSVNSKPPEIVTGDIQPFHIHADSITKNQAYIIWETENLSYGQVEYGVGAGYGTTTPMQERPVFNHSVSLLNLLPETWYHYRVINTDLSGKKGMSLNGTFYTGTPNSVAVTSPLPTPPVVTSPSIPNLNSSPTNQVIKVTESSVVFPPGVSEGDILNFRKSSRVYLVKLDGLHPFTSTKVLQKYQKQFKKRIKYIKNTVTPYTVSKISASAVLGW